MGEYESLRPLPGAEEEGRAIARLYDRSHLLARDQATVQRFVESAPRTSIIHIAAHAIADSQHPEYSRVLLANDAGDDGGVLNAADVARLDLDEVRLVVLSACETIPRTPSGRGATSVAEAFLAAGVPQVIGVRWDIEDSVAAKFFARFHAAVATGKLPAIALREAQLALLRAGSKNRHPRYWAGFELLGGSGPSLRR